MKGGPAVGWSVHIVSLDEDANAGGTPQRIDDRERRVAAAIRLPLTDAPSGYVGQRTAIGKPAEGRSAALELQRQGRDPVIPLRAKLDAGAFGREHDLRRRFTDRSRKQPVRGDREASLADRQIGLDKPDGARGRAGQGCDGDPPP